MPDIEEPLEVIIFKQAIRNTALYAVRKQREADQARRDLESMVAKLNRYQGGSTCLH